MWGKGGGEGAGGEVLIGCPDPQTQLFLVEPWPHALALARGLCNTLKTKTLNRNLNLAS